MNNISSAFENGKAFIPFITCGDPDLQTTKKIIRSMAENGADLIELGIPFSDPVAEGPVIQEASIRALKNKITTDDVLDMAIELRNEGIDIPFVIMTYANVIYSYGIERFMKRAKEAGIAGLILPDVPFEEKEEFESVSLPYGIEMVSMIAPTSKERVEMIAREAKGFIYLVSSLGVTGSRESFESNLAETVDLIRSVSDVPVAIGFGIHNPDQASAMTKISDGAIVGSAIVSLAGEYGTEAAKPIGSFVKDMKSAIKTVPEAADLSEQAAVLLTA